MTARLDVPLRVTLDASGNGTVTASVPWGQRWRVTTFTTQTDQAATTTPYPNCVFYRGGVDPSNIIAATYSGQQDTATGDELFFAGETITVRWTGGVVASRATAHIIGTVEAM